jgi:DNA primase
MVSPSKQIWHCFGCGLGGDVFEFIKQAENVEFAEALKILADRAGVELKKITPQQLETNKKRDVLYEINEAAVKYFMRVMWESQSGQEALEYLRRRGLTDQTIKNWQLGYAPNDYHYLENFLAKTFDKKDIESAGLIIKREEGTGKREEYFDRFHDRVMFPIVNVHGQVVGFTGRLLHDQPNAGKYVNSPETPIYNKSREIYGLFAAKTAIRKENRAILVEGNMDVIACHQAGSANAIATSGTALSEQQLAVIKRFTENLVFAFDSDSAGSTATKRALELALAQGFNVKIAALGDAKDPDELIKKSIGLWQKAINGASNFLDYFFDLMFRQYPADTVEGKREISKELAPLIFRVAEPVTKAHYVRKLAYGLNVAESAIWDIITKLTAPKHLRAARLEQSPAAGRPARPKREILEDRLLGLTLNLGDDQYLKQFQASDFRPGVRELFTALAAGASVSAFQQQIDVLKFSAEMDVREQELDAGSELQKTAAALRKQIIHERMQELSARIAAAEQQKDKTAVAEFSQEYVRLSREMGQYN